MGADVGRELLIKKDAVVICAGISSKSITINNEPVDITNDDDDGWRAYLTKAGVRSLDLSFSGVTKDDTLKTLCTGETILLEDITVEFPDGSTFEGDFIFASLGESGESGTAITFDATLNSSGIITFTPAS